MSRILIIDDDPSILTLFEQYLKSAGYAVTTAPDGQTGLKLLDQRSFDLIITDILMPEMDGLELLLELRKNWKNIPVIAVSGGMKIQPVNFLPQAKKFGAKRIFEKPVTLSELLQAVQKLLEEFPPAAP